MKSKQSQKQKAASKSGCTGVVIVQAPSDNNYDDTHKMGGGHAHIKLSLLLVQQKK